MISSYETERFLKEMKEEMRLNQPLDIVEFALYLLDELEKENIKVESRSKFMWVLFFMHCKYMQKMKKPIPLFRNIQVGKLNFFSNELYNSFTGTMMVITTKESARAFKQLRKSIAELRSVCDDYLYEDEDEEDGFVSDLEMKNVTMEEFVEWAKELLKISDSDFDRFDILSFHDFFREKLFERELVDIDDKELYEEIQNNELFFEFDYVKSLLEHKISFTKRTLKKRG